MSQYSRYSYTGIAPRNNSRCNVRDNLSPVSRAWTITTDQEQDFRRSRTRAPSHHGDSLGNPHHNRNSYSCGSDPPVRIRSPSPLTSRRSPTDNAPTFLAWLRSRSGPHLTHVDVKKVISTMTWDELLQNERKKVLECSVAEQSRVEYSESVFVTSSAVAFSAHQGSRFPPPQYAGLDISGRIARWVNDVSDSQASGSGYGGSWRKGEDAFSQY